jgi:hypothetical protein
MSAPPISKKGRFRDKPGSVDDRQVCRKVASPHKGPLIFGRALSLSFCENLSAAPDASGGASSAGATYSSGR